MGQKNKEVRIISISYIFLILCLFSSPFVFFSLWLPYCNGRLLKLLLKVCDLFSELNESWNCLHHHPSMLVALGLKILTHTLPAKNAKIRARSEPKLRWWPPLAVQCLYVDKIFCKLFCKHSLSLPGTCLEPSQISMLGLFAKIVNG